MSLDPGGRKPTSVVFVDPSDLPAPLAAACHVALGDPAALDWLSVEVEGVRATIDAYMAVAGSGDTQ